MAFQGNRLKQICAAALLSVVTFSAGCGGEDAKSRDTTAGVAPPTGEVIENRVSGSVGDGPIVGAGLLVRAASGQELMRFSSNDLANYEVVIKAKGRDYALTIEATGGTDLVTGGPPDFTLLSAITRPAKRSISNLNPFTTLIFESAKRAGGISDSTVAVARDALMQHYGFGLDPALVPDPTDTPIDDINAAVIVKSSESFGEMVRRTRDTLAAAGSSLDGDKVMGAFAADFTDGFIDGRGASGTNARVAAVAQVAAAAVLVEAAANRLHVYGADATAAMDNAIRQIRPNASSDATTANVRIPSAAFSQAARALLAATVVSSDPVIEQARLVMQSASGGSLPSAIGPRLPAGIDAALSDALIATAYASDSEVESINAVARGESVPSQAVPTENRAPTISGTPNGSTVVGEAWAFTPSASDADGDTLTFTVENKPSWLSFDSQSGRLWGTPTSTDAGEHIDIRLSVSDGLLSTSLAAFSILVNPSVPVGTATVRWTPPTLRVDGTPLDGLGGFTVRYGMDPAKLDNVVRLTNPDLTSYKIDSLGSGTWYFGVTAFDVQGLESEMSNIASKYID